MQPWRRNLWVVAVANFVTMVGMSAFIPFFPDVLREMGISEDRPLKVWSGVLTAAAPLTAALTGPIWGALGDRYGRKLMVIRSLMAIAVFVGLMGAVTSPAVRDRLGLAGWWLTPWPLLALRFGQGVFSGFIAPALTLVTEGAPPDRQGRVTAVSQASLVAGTVVGPAVGAWIAAHGGPHLAFLWCAGTAAIATALVAAVAVEGVLPEAPPDRRRPWNALRSAWVDARRNLATEGLPALMIGLFLVQVANTLVNPVLRLHVEGFAELPPGRMLEVAGYAFSVAALGQILFSRFWGGWTDRVGAVRLIPFTAFLTALTFVPLGLARASGPFLWSRFLQGAAASGTVPAAYAHVGRLSGVGRRGAAFGLALSSFQLANVVGPAAGGCLAAAVGTRPLFFVSAAILAGAALWMRSRL